MTLRERRYHAPKGLANPDIAVRTGADAVSAMAVEDVGAPWDQERDRGFAWNLGIETGLAADRRDADSAARSAIGSWRAAIDLQIAELRGEVSAVRSENRSLSELVRSVLHNIPARRARLSEELSRQLKEFSSWAPDWDGMSAQPISVDVTQRVEALVLDAIDLVGDVSEPEVNAAGDGSLMVDWNLGDTTVGLFVPDATTWEPAAVIRDDIITEIQLTSEADLLDLLLRERNRSLARKADR